MNIKQLAAEVTLLPVVFDGGNMTKDMTTGSPVRLIIGFAIPKMCIRDRPGAYTWYAGDYLKYGQMYVWPLLRCV